MFNDIKNYKYIEKLPIHKFFHINTSLNKETAKLFSQNIIDIRQDSNYINQAGFPFKDIDTTKGINLPEPSKIISKTISEVLFSRSTCRNFENRTLSQQELSDILYYSFGAKNLDENKGYQQYFYPSAGGFNSLKVFVIVNNIKGIDNKLFIYTY